MRILIECIGSYGDVYPFVATGRELKRRGHEVRLFANAHFEGLIREAELPFTASGDAQAYDAFTRHPDTWEPRKGFKNILEMIGRHLPESYHQLEAHHLPEQTLVIGSSLAIASRILQEKHRLPGVKVHLAPSIFRSNIRPPRLPGLVLPDWYPISLKKLIWRLGDFFVIDPKLKGPLNTFRAELGLPAISRFFHEWIHSPDLTIGLFPDWFGDPQPDWPPQARCTGFPLLDAVGDTDLPDEVRTFIAAGSPPVVFTPGTAMRHGADFFAVSATVCRQLGLRGILLTRYAEQIPEKLPEGVRHFPYVPLSALLPHAAVLVHHGGIGTSSQALRAGIPHLVRPMAYDQFDNARHLERLGVGRTIDRKKYKPAALAGALKILTEEPTYAQNCREIAARFIGVDAVADSCDLIEDLTKQAEGSGRGM